MRLLDRPRPQVHHAELIVLAVPGENLARRPRLEHQRQRLAEALALLDRHDDAGDHRVRRQAGAQAGDQAHTADSSAMRVDDVVDGRVEPSWTMAMFWPLVSFASTAPIRLGLAMKP